MSNRGKYYLGNNIDTFDVMPMPGDVVKVILNIDENNYVQSPAQDDGAVGITVEADCPYATQMIADNILQILKKRKYVPYVADGAALDPSAELGDGITSNGVYSGIYSLSKDFDRRSSANISAPINSETEHEFQYTDAQDRKFSRQVAKIGSELALKMDTIYAKVTGPGTSFGWELTDNGMTWKSNGGEVMKLDSNGLTITGTLAAHAVITGQLEVGGTDMTAGVLGAGALDGYGWMNDYDYSYGGISYTGAGYTLGGGLGGFHFGSSTVENTDTYPWWFSCGNLRVVGSGSGYIFNHGVTFVVGTKTYCCLGYEVTSGN